MSYRNSILDDILHMSWPTGVVSAIGVFLAFQLFVGMIPPDLGDGSSRLVIESVGFVFCILLLFAALLSYIAEKVRNRRFKKDHHPGRHAHTGRKQR